MSCELSAPLSQCGFSNIEPLPLLAHRLDDEVYVRMLLVRVQNQGIAMLEGKLFAGKVAARGQQLLGRRTLGHRENDVVDELRWPATRRAPVRPTGLRVHGFQVPVSHQTRLDVLSLDPLPFVGFDFELALPVDVLEVCDRTSL